MPDGTLTEIERRVARDRAALAQSLDTLSDTLSPTRLKNEASQAAEIYGSDLTRQVWDATRENPAAFALVGAGLALLMSGAGRRPEHDATPAYATDPAHPAVPDAVPPLEAMAGFDERVAAADVTLREDSTGTMDDDISSSRLRAALNRGLDQLPPAARRRVLDARIQAIRAQDAVERRAAKLGRQSSQMISKQPIAVGAAAFGIGALIGTLLPGTRREDEWMGHQRDALMQEAQTAFRREMDAVQDMAAPQPDNVAPLRADARAGRV